MTFFRKKYYREVPCKACEETGKQYLSSVNWLVQDSKLTISNDDNRFFICPACNGKGTQTVLEKVE